MNDIVGLGKYPHEWVARPVQGGASNRRMLVAKVAGRPLVLCELFKKKHPTTSREFVEAVPRIPCGVFFAEIGNTFDTVSIAEEIIDGIDWDHWINCHLAAVEERAASIDATSATEPPPPDPQTLALGAARKEQPFHPVERPAHYNFGSIEVIDVLEDWQLSFHSANAVKYIARAPHKGTRIQDLEKAAWYLKREIELLRRVK